MFSSRSHWLRFLSLRSSNRARKYSRSRRQSSSASAIEILEDRTLLSNISIGDANVVEFAAGTVFVNFTVTRDANTTAETVTYTTNDGTATTADSDYTTTAATISFAIGGALTATISVPVSGDTKVEADETFTVDIINSTGGAVITGQQGVGTITNDDTATLTIANISAAEGNAGTSFQVFQITLNNEVVGGATVNYATANGTATAGTDYIASSGTLTFSGTAGEVIAFPIGVTGDSAFEANETFTVTLSGITALGAGVSSGDIAAVGSPATGTITNDDTASLTISDVTAVETNSGATAFLFTVSLDNATTFAFTVNYATANATAVSGSDYAVTSGTLNFAGTTGETQSIAVLVTGETAIEFDETFQVNLSGATGGILIGDSQGIGTITNDDVAIPVAPTLTSPSGIINDTMPAITWLSVTGAVTYELLVYNTTAGQEVVNQTGIATTQFTPGTPLVQGMHQAYVRAVNGTGNSPYSAALYFDVELDTPALPSVSASTTDTTPTISWTAVTGAATYELLVYDIGLGQLAVHQTGLATNSFTPTTPLAQTMHQIYVRAFDTFSDSTPYSTPQSLDVGVSQPTMTGPAASVGDTTPTFTWTPVIGATYELLVYNIAAGQVIIHQANLATNSFTPTTELAVTGHRAFVRAVDGNSVAGPYSAAYDFNVTLETPVVSGPPTTTHDTTPTLTWTPVAGAVDYEVLIYHTASGQLVVNQTGVVATQYTTALLRQGTHQVFVRSTDGSGGVGSYSTPIYFNVVLGIPTLTSPAALSGDRTPTFVWTGVTGAVSYELLVYNVTTGQQDGRVSGITATQFTQLTPVSSGTYQVFVRAFDGFSSPGPYSQGRYFQITNATDETPVWKPAELLDNAEEPAIEFASTVIPQTTEMIHNQSLVPLKTPSSVPVDNPVNELSVLDAILADWPEQDLWETLTPSVVSTPSESELPETHTSPTKQAALLLASALVTLRSNKPLSPKASPKHRRGKAKPRQ